MLYIFFYLIFFHIFNPGTSSYNEREVIIIRTGINFLCNGKFDEALDIFDDLKYNNNDSLASNLFKAISYSFIMDKYRSTKFDSAFFQSSNNAIKIGEELLSSDKKNPKIHLYLGGAYGIRGVRKTMLGDLWGGISDGLKAHKLLHKTVELNPDMYDAYYGLGMYHYWKSKRAYMVIRIFGWLFRIKDEKEKGIQELFLAMEKGYYAKFPTIQALLRIYIEEKKYDEVISLGMEYKKEFPNDVFYRWFVGMAYINKQRWKEGFEIYDEIEKNLESINFNGREADVECWYYKAICLYHLGRKEEALMLCKKIDEIKEVVNRKVFFYGDYIEMSSELMSKINIKSLNDK